LTLALLVVVPAPAATPDAYAVGVAQVDITPAYPVRLSGFGFRRTESDGVTQRIWAKALALDDGEPAVLLTVDNLGIPTYMVQEVAQRLHKKARLRPERLAVTATHTHTAPMLKGVAPTLFSQPIPKEHQDRIDRYTAELTDKLEQVALAALADRQPARLTWGVGTVRFAVNRRTRGGPVDHDLPVLVARDLKGKVRAVYVGYACHCVTLSNNKVSGDWAGYAQQAIQDDHPGAVALVSIGCGADANPSSGVTGDRAEVGARQGAEIAAEVKRLLGGFLAPVTGKLTAAVSRFELPLAPLPTRAGWEERARRNGAVGYHARVNLGRLDRGDPLRDRIDYSVQTWTFGDALAMVFLPGEVVADYSLRLKRELDGLRLWVTAYANDAPCYIPSERVLKEGGYEGGDAMVYYDVPVPFAPGLEQRIVDAAHRSLDSRFKAPFDSQRTAGSRPLSPQQSLATIRTKKDLVVELVAAEPLVVDPVAIDFGPDGRLWVAEMLDYPAGRAGDYKPGGRVRVLEDTDGDGRYDKATVFLDNIPFPTGITVYGRGVLVCAAPDILYAEDTKGDGKANVVLPLYSGFGTENYQARVNSLEYGLDGWIYGSCGMFGGTIRCNPYVPRTSRGEEVKGRTVALGHRDFRIKPKLALLEPATGRTQQGRVRDDWGNWFGCDNSTLCRHYPLADHYLRRNPYVPLPDQDVLVPDYPNPNRLYPIQQQMQLFKLSGPPGQTTAACGLGIYRDNLLGEEYHGDAFVCESVNLLVHRLKLTPRGCTFSGRRAADEAASEFLAATDTWFRPVQVRTGPDGALYVVDMYRFVIEHPRWIPPADLAKLDVRAGSTLGRIYRVRPKNRELRPVPRLDKLDTAGLVAALDSPNGWQRDLASDRLLSEGKSAVKPLEALAANSPRAEARLHALCVLGAMGEQKSAVVQAALADSHPGVRRHAIRLAEPLLAKAPELGGALLNLLDDADAQVRLQLAYTLGEWRDDRAGRALATLALRHADDPYLTAAVLSSVHGGNVAAVLAGVFASPTEVGPPPPLVRRLLGVAAALGDKQALPSALRAVATPRQGRFAPWQLAALAGVLDALERRGGSLDTLADAAATEQVRAMLARARVLAADDKTAEADRLAALQLLGRDPAQRDAELALLGKLVVPSQPAAVQAAALAALGRMSEERVAAVLAAGWAGYSPALKSQALDLLLSRDAWQRRLLEAIEKNEVPAAQIDAGRRQRLLTHREESVRTRAARLFAGGTSADRQKVLAAYRDAASLPGDASIGKMVFVKTCAVCHRLGDVGHAVGPDLAAVSNKSPQYLLQEILDPNRNLDTRYLEYLAITKAGQTFTGLLASETSTSITLRGQEGKQQVLLRNELEELRSTGKSLMPEGLEKDLKPQDLADLIAFLAGSGPPPKQFAGNRPEVVRPANGTLTLLATNAEIYGDAIVFEEPFRNIGYWSGPRDHVVWRAHLDRAGEFDVYLDWACDNQVAGNAYVFEGGRPELRGKVPGTGGWDHYRKAKIGTVSLDAGAQRFTFRPDGDHVAGALLDLRGVYLVAKGQKPAFAAADPPTDPADLARQILDEKLSAADRQVLIGRHPDSAADLVAALVADMRPGTPEEYRRIPWLWRVAVAAGKRNDTGQLRRLLAVALPKAHEPLRDWQAVAVGGGIINGLSLQGVWPGERLPELLKGDAGLTERWQRSLPRAAIMADNEKVPTGTRYDALRMIALDDWERCGPQLTKYLAKGVHDELQMGAISGLSDATSPQVAPLLLAGLEHFSAGNRKLAVDALLRTQARTAALLDALEQGKVKPTVLAESHKQALRTLKDDALRARAARLLPQ
jgi:putative membrane-bound dehydrogenase-like protein